MIKNTEPNRDCIDEDKTPPSSMRKVDSQNQNNSGHCRPTMNEWFRRFAHRTSEIVGSAGSFLLAILIIVVWGVSGPAFGFSDTWQLVINTSTTIVTFLMVFLIQNTQNRDAKAIHLKLDELIHAVKGARNNLINLENLSEEEIAQIQAHFKKISDTHRNSGGPSILSSTGDIEAR